MVALLVACGEPAPARSADPRCKKAYKPLLCLGEERECTYDKNGCEVCTCNSQMQQHEQPER